MTEQILLMNPRKGRMPAGLARYWAKKRRRKRHANPKPRRRAVRAKSSRRHRRRIHFKRTVRRYAAAARRHVYRHRRRRSNPRFSVAGIKGQVVGTVVPAVIGGVGAVGLDLAWGYGAGYLPAPLQTGWGATGAKVGAALLIGYALSRFTPVSKRAVASGVLGAVTVIAYQAIRDFAKTTFPDAKGLGGYADYIDYSVLNRAGMGAYMPGGRPQLGFVNPAPLLDQSVPGMGAYMPHDVGQMHGYTSDGM